MSDVVCLNKTTDQRVNLSLNAGESKFNFTDAGLVTSPGDKISISIGGRIE